MDAVRLRLLFEGSVLSEKQKAERLKRCWLLLEPERHKNISDFSCHLLSLFHLHDSCPSGLLLSMDGYYLPPFESTSIFKDKDIVRIKRKEVKNGAEMVTDECDDQTLENLNQSLIKIPEAKLFPKRNDCKQIRDKDISSSSEHSECTLREEPEDDALVGQRRMVKTNGVSKKRKALKDDLSRSHKKKKSDNVSNGVLHHNEVKSALGENIENVSSTKVNKRKNKKTKTIEDLVHPCSPMKNDDKSVIVTQSTGEGKKLPSRSTRRKKARRRWLREMSKAQKMEEDKTDVTCQEVLETPIKDKGLLQNGLRTQKQTLSRTSDDDSGENIQSLSEDSETDEDVVPVVIRPGHIRFQSPRTTRSDLISETDTGSLVNMQWSNTSKRKGQKWGTEKASISIRSVHLTHSPLQSETVVTESENCDKASIDFSKCNLYEAPKVGDVIAYQLIELSESWTPEISSYRVGKILRYDGGTNTITLTPVEQFPLPKRIQNEETPLQSENFPCTNDYMEDGLLEISYDSLVEVRLVYHGNESSLPKQDTEKKQENGGSVSSTQENEKIKMLDEVKKLMEMKKAELMKDEESKKPEQTRRNKWSCRTLRGSALGPTMARLRSENSM